MTATTNTVASTEFVDIMSSLRRAVEWLPPVTTAKDIVFIHDGGETTGFVVTYGPRAGIYFIDRMVMDAFVRRMEQRDDFTKYPELAGSIVEGHKLGGFHGIGGLRLSVPDSLTWIAVVSMCHAGVHELVNEWLRGKPWASRGTIGFRRIGYDRPRHPFRPVRCTTT